MEHVVPTLVPAARVAAVPVLEYGPARSDTNVRDRLRWVFFALTVPGCVAVFLPFTWNVSPWAAVVEVLLEEPVRVFRQPGDLGVIFLLAVPFFVAFALALLRLRMACLWRVARGESIGAGVVAALSAACTGGIVYFMLDESPEEWTAWVTSAAAVILLVGAGALTWVRRRRLSNGARALVLLYGAYLANAAICLIVFYDDPDARATSSQPGRVRRRWSTRRAC